MTLLVESSDEPLCVCVENGCMYNFCGGDIFCDANDVFYKCGEYQSCR